MANRSQRGKFVYELPENLTQVYELYLDDCEWDEGRKTRKSRRKARLSRKEYEEVLNMVLNRKTDWGVVFDLFHHGGISVDSFLMGPDFFEIARECYNRQYPNIIFSDFLWTLRSIYLPLFWALNMDVQKLSVPLCCYRLCRCTRKYGKAFPRKLASDLRAWNLYPRERRGADQSTVGKRCLQKYLDRTVQEDVTSGVW